MESYVERWKREQEEKEQKGVGKNGRRTEEAQNEREGQKSKCLDLSVQENSL